jgi:hypothetical protein
MGYYCRYHAINNLMGYDVCSTKEFDALCDEWDTINSFPKHHSKRTFAFYNNGGTDGADNLFGFVLKKYNIHIKITGYDFHNKKPIIPNNALGAILFNTRHTWAIRKHDDDKWWVHDSLRPPYVYRHISTNRYAALYCFHK